MTRKEYLEEYGRIWREARSDYRKAAADLERLNQQAKAEAAAASQHNQILSLEVEKRTEALVAYNAR